MKRNGVQAFTFIEMSIVLVIIGLLAGSVLAGQALIHASELRGVSSEYNQYIAAVSTFRDKYFFLPGDLPAATKYWGAGTCPGDEAHPRTSQATCNGNGNGMLEYSSYLWIANYTNEIFNFWHHLQNAGLITGPIFAGVSVTGNFNDTHTHGGVNVPKSKFSGTVWSILNLGEVPISDPYFIEGSYGHAFMLGGDWVSSGYASYNSYPLITPEDAYNIDVKMDDGKAGSGKVMAYEEMYGCFLMPNGATAGNSTTAARNTVVYNIKSTSPSCTLLIKTGF